MRRAFARSLARRIPASMVRRVAWGRALLPVLLAAYLFEEGRLEQSAASIALAVVSVTAGFFSLRLSGGLASFLWTSAVLGDSAAVVLAGPPRWTPEVLFLALALFPIAEMAFLLGPAAAGATTVAVAVLLASRSGSHRPAMAIGILIAAVPVLFFARWTSRFARRFWLPETASRVLEAAGLRLDPIELLRRWGAEITAWAGRECVALFLLEGERWIRVFPENPKGSLPSYPEPTLSRALSQEEPFAVAPQPSGPYSILFPFSARNSPRGVLAVWHRRRMIWPAEIGEWHELSLEISQSLNALRRAQKHREQAIGQERARIAAELHDGFLQSLLSVKLHAEVCSNLKTERALRAELPRTRYLLHTVVNEVRQFLLELRPAPPRAEDFLPALKEYAEEFQHRNGIPVEIRVEGEGMFSDEQAEELTALVREALTNIRKHAEARSVRVVVAFSGDYGTVSISDDGVGFDVKSTLERLAESSHHGLIGMRQRVEGLRGDARFRSEPGKGTTLLFRVPREHEEPPAERRRGKAS